MPLTSEERQALIEKLEELAEQSNEAILSCKRKADEYYCQGKMHAFREMKGIIQAMPEQAELTNTKALIKLRDAIRTWWDRLYPDDVFDGSSGDEGALTVVEIRNLIKATEQANPKGLDKPDRKGWWWIEQFVTQMEYEPVIVKKDLASFIDCRSDIHNISKYKGKWYHIELPESEG